MTHAAVSIDLTTAPGAVVSSVADLVAGEEQRLIDLAGLVLVVARAGSQDLSVSIVNLSPAQIAWSDAVGRGAGTLAPEEQLELPVPVPGGPAGPPPQPACVQLIVGGALALTLTVAAVGEPPRRRVIAQALVSS